MKTKKKSIGINFFGYESNEKCPNYLSINTFIGHVDC